MLEIELIIFDCDGVLADSESLAHGLELDLLTSWGIEMTPSSYEALVLGKTQKEIYALLEERFKDCLPPDFRERHEALLLKTFREKLKPIEGMRELIRHLFVPKAVASNSDRRRLEIVLEIIGLKAFFSPHIYSYEVVGKGKPHPDLHLFVAEQFGTSPERCLVIEDSPTGATAALRAGMNVLGFIQPQDRESVTAHALRKLPCWDYVTSAKEILQKLNQTSLASLKRA